jgi:hypothetical protein
VDSNEKKKKNGNGKEVSFYDPQIRFITLFSCYQLFHFDNISTLFHPNFPACICDNSAMS